MNRWGAVATVLLLLGTACRSSSDAGSLGELLDETADRRLVLEVRGARTVDIDQVVPVRVLTRTGTGDQAFASVASVTLREGIEFTPGTLVNPEVAIVGSYGSDGTFEVPAGLGQAPPKGPSATTAPGTASNASVLQVTFLTRQPPGELRFGHLLEPCKVVLRDGAKAGSADCPALVAINGEQVSMRMRWGPAED